MYVYMFVIFIAQLLMEVNRASWAHSSLKYFLTLTDPALSSPHCVLRRFLKFYSVKYSMSKFLKIMAVLPRLAISPFSCSASILGPHYAHLISVCWNLRVSISIKSLPLSSPLPSTCCFLPGKWERTIPSSWSILRCPCCGRFAVSWPSVLVSWKHLKRPDNPGAWCCALFCT